METPLTALIRAARAELCPLRLNKVGVLMVVALLGSSDTQPLTQDVAAWRRVLRTGSAMVYYHRPRLREFPVRFTCNWQLLRRR